MYFSLLLIVIVMPQQNLTVAERGSALRIVTLENAQFTSTVIGIPIVFLKSERKSLPAVCSTGLESFPRHFVDNAKKMRGCDYRGSLI